MMWIRDHVHNGIVNIHIKDLETIVFGLQLWDKGLKFVIVELRINVLLINTDTLEHVEAWYDAA